MDYDILNEARGVRVSFCQPVDVCFEEMKLYLHFDAELALLLKPFSVRLTESVSSELYYSRFSKTKNMVFMLL